MAKRIKPCNSTFFLSQLPVVSFRSQPTGDSTLGHRRSNPLGLLGPGKMVRSGREPSTIDGQLNESSQQQHSLLLHYASPAVQDLFETLQEPKSAHRIKQLQCWTPISRWSRTVNVQVGASPLSPNAGETTDHGLFLACNKLSTANKVLSRDCPGTTYVASPARIDCRSHGGWGSNTLGDSRVQCQALQVQLTSSRHQGEED